MRMESGLRLGALASVNYWCGNGNPRLVASCHRLLPTLTSSSEVFLFVLCVCAFIDVLKQQGHSLDVTCIAYSPDGSVFATGGDDGRIKVWDARSGQCFVTFSVGHSKDSSAVAGAHVGSGGITGLTFTMSRALVAVSMFSLSLSCLGFSCCFCFFLLSSLSPRFPLSLLSISFSFFSFLLNTPCRLPNSHVATALSKHST